MVKPYYKCTLSCKLFLWILCILHHVISNLVNTKIAKQTAQFCLYLCVFCFIIYCWGFTHCFTNIQYRLSNCDNVLRQSFVQFTEVIRIWGYMTEPFLSVCPSALLDKLCVLCLNVTDSASFVQLRLMIYLSILLVKMKQKPVIDSAAVTYWFYWGMNPYDTIGQCSIVTLAWIPHFHC